MRTRFEAFVIRILNQRGDAVGAGFLVTERHALTCAHVITAALGLRETPKDAPQNEVSLDFPLTAPGELQIGRVITWLPSEEGEDFAVLELSTDPPSGTIPATLVQAEDLWGHEFRAFGFPAGFDNGVWASGRLLGSQAEKWVQVEDVKATGYAIEQGFSGGPVWDQELDGVAGMVVATDPRHNIKTAFIIPTETLIAGWPDLQKRTIPPCPYRGLSVFREVDTPFFFGRQDFSKKLLNFVQRKSLVAVVGSSGSGKSSVVFAGLLPLLRKDPDWAILDFRPGSQPFESFSQVILTHLEPEMTEREQILETEKYAEEFRSGELKLFKILTRLLKKCSPASRLLIIVDQFEELYTQVPEIKANIRTQFINAILKTIEETEGITFIFTIRADFLGQVFGYRPLADALQDADLKLGPMNKEELQQAIEQPAEIYNIYFEPGLVTRLLDDVGNEPGQLPLLEFALTLLWDRQEHGRITHAAYDEIGQVEGALAGYADEIIKELSPVEQSQAHRIFIQMVTPGSGTEDTRRQAKRGEIESLSWTLVERMAKARLVVTSRAPTGEEVAEVVHETLIRNWGKMRDWMKADRVFRAWQERLRAALRQWEANKQDKGGLLRGLPLAEAENWLNKRPNDISPSETKYIQESINAHIAREKRKNWIFVGSIAVAILMIILAAFGVYQTQEAREQTGFALTALSESRVRGTEAAREASRANIASTQASSEAATAQAAEEGLRSQLAQTISHQGEILYEENPLLGLSLVLEAWKIAQSSYIDIKDSIEEVIYRLASKGRLRKLGDSVYGVVPNNNHSLIVLYRYREPGVVITANGEKIPLSGEIMTQNSVIVGVNFSPAESYVVIGYEDMPGEMVLASGDVIQLSGILDSWSEPQFSSNGTYNLVHYKDGSSEIYLSSGEAFPLSGKSPLQVYFSPDESYFIVNYEDAPDEIIYADGEVLPLPGDIDGLGVTFHPDGDYCVMKYEDAPGELRRANGDVIPLSGVISWVDINHNGGEYFYVRYENAPSELRRANGEVVPISGVIEKVNFSPGDEYIVVDYVEAPGEIFLASGEVIPLSGIIEKVNFGLENDYFVVDYVEAPGELRRANGDVIPLSGTIDWATCYRNYFEVIYNDEPIEIRLSANGEVIPFSGVIGSNYNSVYFDPDGNFVVVKYGDAPSEIHLSANGEVIPLSGTIQYEGVYYAPEEDYFVVGYSDAPGELRLSNGDVIPLQGNINDVSISSDGAYFVAKYTDNSSEIYQANGEMVPLSGDLEDVYFSPGYDYFVVDYDQAPGEIFQANGKSIRLSNEIIEATDFYPDGTYFVVNLRNEGGQLWFYQNEPRFIADLGPRLTFSEFYSHKPQLFLSYINGMAYLVDRDWLQTMAGNPKDITIENLIKILCNGPLASEYFDETALIQLLGDQEPHVCNR